MLRKLSITGLKCLGTQHVMEAGHEVHNKYHKQHSEYLRNTSLVLTA